MQKLQKTPRTRATWARRSPGCSRPGRRFRLRAWTPCGRTRRRRRRRGTRTRGRPWWSAAACASRTCTGGRRRWSLSCRTLVSCGRAAWAGGSSTATIGSLSLRTGSARTGGALCGRTRARWRAAWGFPGRRGFPSETGCRTCATESAGDVLLGEAWLRTGIGSCIVQGYISCSIDNYYSTGALL